jgi:hypothetical protein
VVQIDSLFGKSLRFEIDRPGYALLLKTDGDFELNDPEDDFVAIEDELSLEETIGGVTRQLEIVDEGGRLVRRYRVDGDERPFDAETRRWLAEALPRMLRETGVGADERAARIHARGGSAALLAEIDLIASSHGRGRYLRAMLALPGLDPGAVSAAVGRAVQLDGDYERRVVLVAALDNAALSASALASVLDGAGGIGSDYERRVLLQQAASRIGASEDLQQRWVAALRDMDSSYEMRVALQALASQPLQPAAMARALAAVDAIDSDYEKRVALQSLARHVGSQAGVMAAYAAALDEIDSDYERRVAIESLLEAHQPDAPAALALLPAIKDIGSDYECRLALQALAQSMPGDAELIRQYRAVARGLGDFERGQAEKALDRFDS